MTTRKWRFFTVEGDTFFYALGKKRNHRFRAVFALSENSNLWCFKQIFECLFPPGSFFCYSVLFSFLFWCVMSNKCCQNNLLFQYTIQSHLFILCFPEIFELIDLILYFRLFHLCIFSCFHLDYFFPHLSFFTCVWKLWSLVIFVILNFLEV